MSDNPKRKVSRRANERYTGVLKLLDVLLSPIISAEEKYRVLGGEFGIPLTVGEKGDIEDMCNLSVGFYEKGHKEGKKEGKIEGIIEGVEVGSDDAFAAMDLIAKGVNTLKGLVDNGISESVAKKALARL